jgi:hypothetical protein
VDLLNKECNRAQIEPPVDTAKTKQWTQVSYTHQNPPTLQQQTADRTLNQHISETANCFEILSNPSAGLDNYKIENKAVKQTGEYSNPRQGTSHRRRMTNSEVVKYTRRIYLIEFQH